MNEKRVYQMCRLAIFEEEHKDQLDGARGHFRSDYIGKHMIRSALRTTAAYLLILAGWGLFHFDQLTLKISEVDLKLLGTGILSGYIGLMGTMLFLTYVIWSRRYADAEKHLIYYQKSLKKLNTLYEEEDEALRVRSSFKRS